MKDDIERKGRKGRKGRKLENGKLDSRVELETQRLEEKNRE